MKKSEKRILIIELFLLTVLLFNIFVLNIFTDLKLSIFLITIFFAMYSYFGIEKDNFINRNDIIMTIVIYVIIYYILTYLIGIFSGFLLNGYSLKIINIIKNIFPVIVLQTSKELLRYEINTKAQGKKTLLVISTLVFVLIDTSSILFMYDLNDAYGILSLIEISLVPIISENILMTYLSIRAGYKATIIYGLLMSLPAYFIPIIPDINTYISIIFRLCLPAFILYMIATSQKNHRKLIIEKIRNSNRKSKIGFAISVVLLLTMVYLTCGAFTYYALTIGSPSMVPNLNKGDIAIVKKVKDCNELEIGDILVYKKESKVVVHRLTKIIPKNNITIYKTKGDANNDEDPYPIYEEDIIGKVTFKVKYIGYPTVWINELVS